MARTVRNPKLDTRSARAKLKPRREPYWCAIAPGRAIGYRRIGPQGGTWIAKLRIAGAGRWLHALGPADDVLDAGEDILTFAQAQERARAWFVQQENATTLPLQLDETPTGPFTVADALDAYLAWFAGHRKSLVASRSVIEAHIRPALGAIEAGKLSTGEIRRWHQTLADCPAMVRARRGGPRHYREPPTDPEATRARRSTANRVLTVLKAALHHVWSHPPEGREAAVAAFDPEAWRKVKPFRGADAARVRYLSEDECRRLINGCVADFRQLVHGALVTGCRYGELGRLEVRDFNGDAGTVQVRESKGGKPRWVPLDDEGQAFLEAMTAGREGGERMFRRAYGGAWGKSHQARPLLEACAAARINPPASFHILRHTWASHRVMRGMPLLAVAQLLGHSDTRMVEKHYGHLAPSYLRDMVRRTALDLGPHDAGNIASLRPAAAK